MIDLLTRFGSGKICHLDSSSLFQTSYLFQALVGQPLLTKYMTTESQWKEVALAAMDLEREYAMRRTMLMTRLNATLQSFTWKDRKLSPEMLDVVSMRVFQGRAFTNVTAADVLAARRDQTILTKVSSVPPATRQDKGSTALTKVKIGQVPDRGGERRHSIPRGCL